MNQKHTPGPWLVSELVADSAVIRVSRTYEVVTPEYDVCADLPWGGPIRNEADARLIAAAPALLAACAQAIDELPTHGELCEGSEGCGLGQGAGEEECQGAIIYKLRAAIAKASPQAR